MGLGGGNPAARAIDRQGALFGHPAGLAILFFTEMWERFSYYGMRALLTLYLIKHFSFQERASYILYGTYTALAYLTPAIGGYVADRWLGARKAVLLGGVLLTFGHFLMAFEGNGGHEPFYLNLLYLALSFIAVGVGFLKANVSVLVGSLYARDDKRRDPAFTIFYMGINVGAALGALLAGYLGERLGWSYGFGVAGLGMLAGLIIFTAGKATLMGQGEAPDPAALRERIAGVPREWLIYGGSLVGVGAAWLLVQNQAVVGALLGGAGGMLVVYILLTSFRTLPRIDRDRMIAAIALMVLSVLFFALSEQAGSSLSVFTDRGVDRRMFGVLVPASLFLSINPLLIIMLAPVLASSWTYLAKRRREPSTPAKFGLAMICLGAGFGILVLGAHLSSGLTPAIFVVLIYFMQTIGELCLSPIGLSAMSRLAVPQMAGLVMGTWFFAQAGGNFLAGIIAGASGGYGGGADQIIAVYQILGWAGLAVGIAILIISGKLNQLMHGDIG